MVEGCTIGKGSINTRNGGEALHPHVNIYYEVPATLIQTCNILSSIKYCNLGKDSSAWEKCLKSVNLFLYQVTWVNPEQFIRWVIDG